VSSEAVVIRGRCSPEEERTLRGLDPTKHEMSEYACDEWTRATIRDECEAKRLNWRSLERDREPGVETDSSAIVSLSADDVAPTVRGGCIAASPARRSHGRQPAAAQSDGQKAPKSPPHWAGC